jgi:hypothetical protein
MHTSSTWFSVTDIEDSVLLQHVYKIYGVRDSKISNITVNIVNSIHWKPSDSHSLMKKGTTFHYKNRKDIKREPLLGVSYYLLIKKSISKHTYD